jgi:hypothetical protein
MDGSASRSLFWPIGIAPWLLALAGFGVGVDQAVEMARQAGTYGTAQGDWFLMLAGAISATICMVVFVGACAIWRSVRR